MVISMNLDSATFLSIGLGVQSTAIALLLVHEPERLVALGLTLPRSVVFADTGAETDFLYQHKDRIFSLLQSAGYDCAVVRKLDKDGAFIPIHKSVRGLASVPWRTLAPDGKKGMLLRQCTQDFKIEPIHKYIRTSLGYQKYKRIPLGSARLWLGISSDEHHRVRSSKVRWIENVYPLLYLNWSRTDCAVYCYHHLGYSVPKSSCFFCPFTHRSEWVRRKNHAPDDFARAVELEKSLSEFRDRPEFGKIDHELFVHPLCIPLDEATPNQLTLPLGADFGFASECSGLCDV
jgi:hypothetical protein